MQCRERALVNAQERCGTEVRVTGATYVRASARKRALTSLGCDWRTPAYDCGRLYWIVGLEDVVQPFRRLIITLGDLLNIQELLQRL